MSDDHKFTRRGPGIPACTCGEVFEWKYEFEDHVKAHDRHREDPTR